MRHKEVAIEPPETPPFNSMTADLTFLIFTEPVFILQGRDQKVRSHVTGNRVLE